MKIMRALSKGVMKRMPSAATKSCQSYNDILNELVVTQALSQLHDGVIVEGQQNALFRAPFFCLIHEIKVVSGNLERTLSKSSSESGKTSHQNNKQDPDNNRADDKNRPEAKDEELRSLSEDDRMLVEALPHEYVISVMRHDGQPLWWMMTHKKLTAEQLSSVLVQVIVGIAIAETVYLYEHRDLHVSNILIKKTSNSLIPFVLNGKRYNILSNGVKATIIDATFSRLSHNGKVYYRDLTSTLRAYGSKKTPTRMSLQNRSYRQMVHITKNNWEQFAPKTNLIWLTYLCETLMKNEIMTANPTLLNEVKKIRDYTLKVSNTYDLLKYFPFDREKPKVAGATSPKATTSQKTQVNTTNSRKHTNKDTAKLLKTTEKSYRSLKEALRSSLKGQTQTSSKQQVINKQVQPSTSHVTDGSSFKDSIISTQSASSELSAISKALGNKSTLSDVKSSKSLNSNQAKRK